MRAEIAGRLQPGRQRIADDHPRAAVAGQLQVHQADRPGAHDHHVVAQAHQRHLVPIDHTGQRLAERRLVETDVVRDAAQLRERRDALLREPTAHRPAQVLAVVEHAPPALIAAPADVAPVRHHPIADLQLAGGAGYGLAVVRQPDLLDHTGPLVPRRARQGQPAARPRPKVAADVAGADATRLDADQRFARPGTRILDLFDPQITHTVEPRRLHLRCPLPIFAGT